MAVRSARDLRELVVRSRQGHRGDDEERCCSSTDDDDINDDGLHESNNSISSSCSNGSSYPSRSQSSNSNSSNATRHPHPNQTIMNSYGHNKPLLQRSRIGGSDSTTGTVIQNQRPPSTHPCPSVSSASSSSGGGLSNRLYRFSTSTSSTASSLNNSIRSHSGAVGNGNNNMVGCSGVIEKALGFIDATYIGSWLVESRQNLIRLQQWWVQDDNAVQLAHFWIEIADQKERKDNLRLAALNVRSELGKSFAVGCESSSIVESDVDAVMAVIFHEYKDIVEHDTTSAGISIECLHVLCSPGERFREFLSNLRYQVGSAQIAEWLLALRSWAVITFFAAVVANVRDDFTLNGPLVVSSSMAASHSRRPVTPSQRPSSHSGGIPTSSQLYMNYFHGDSDVAVRSHEESMLLQAITLAHTSVVRLLIMRIGVSPVTCDNQCRSALFIAAHLGHFDVAETLLDDPRTGATINKPSDAGSSPLHTAASGGHVNVMRLLLGAGADPNLPNIKCDGATPIHIAVMGGHVDAVKVLLEYGAHANAVMGNVSALDLAEMNESKVICQLLMPIK